MNWLLRAYLRILEMLDREQVLAFQGMYYVLFSVGGAAMLLVPGIDAAAGQVYLMLGPASYRGWAIMVTLCPPITMIGRRLTSRSTGLAAGDPNPAWGAAWLQFTGDFGVWTAINIFCWELFRYDHHWWSENLFLFLFLVMGVLGGFMFTFRSVRRLVAIKRQVRSSQKAGS
jgi:hypothetical protein